MDYWVYGLGISSNVVIPAFGRSRSLPNSEIHFEMGPAPAWVIEGSAPPSEIVHSPSSPQQRDSQLTVSSFRSGKFLELRYEDGSRFVVDGSATRIWGEAGRGLGPEDIFTYLVGPVMGFALQRRKKLVLHASSVVVKGGAIAICGEAGSGKSTTAAALALRGNPVLCEDICPLQCLEGRMNVMPGYPRISLWPDSVSHLFVSADALPVIVAGWEKRYLALDGSVANFAEQPVPLCAVYLLEPRSGDTAAPFVEPLSHRQTALALVQNTYMNYLLTKEQRAAEFYAVANLVTEVECYRVIPHRDPARLTDLASLIESHAADVIKRLEFSTTHVVRADVQP